MIELPERPGWQQHAACRGTDPKLFYAEQAGHGAHSLMRDARTVCNGCPVRSDCLNWAINNDEVEWGVWGGMSPRERMQYRARLNARRRRMLEVFAELREEVAA